MKNLLSIGLTTLVLSGLTACGGSSGDGGAVNNEYRFTLEPLAPGDRPWILLEGAAMDPKHLTFNTDFEYLDQGSSHGVGDRYPSTLNEINRSLLSYNNNATALSDIAISYDITSSNTSVVSFENGRLVANSPGKASLTITLDTTKSLGDVFDTDDVNFSGFQGTYEFGEVTVCPYVDMDLEVGSTQASTFYQDSEATLHAISYITQSFDIVSATVIGYPEIDLEALSGAGLTADDCSLKRTTNNNSVEVNPLIHAEASLRDFAYNDNFATQTNIELLGFGFPNITMSRITSFSNAEITAAGFGGNIVPNAINPVTVEAFSSELNATVDISHFYFASGINNDYSGVVGLAIKEEDATIGGSYNIELQQTHLDTLTAGPYPVKEGIANAKLNKKSGLPGSTFKVLSSLTVEDQTYDTSQLFNINGSATDLTAGLIDNSNGVSTFNAGNTFTVFDSLQGRFSVYIDDRIDLNFVVGNTTDAAIRGRWVQADTGEDHFIAQHSVHDYTVVSDDLITFQDSQNRTASLIRTGIDNVAVSGTVDVVQDPAASSLVYAKPGYSANSLGGIADIDLVLENVNTGEEIDVSVAEDGTFSEEVPTGEYDVSGTASSGDISYEINTRITVENDSTDTGTLNLAQVGLYNFDFTISGCDNGYKCYPGRSYNFTITAKNIGYIAASGIIPTIGNGSTIDHPEVSSSNVPAAQIISGMGPGDTITYTFSATFNTPSEDTLVEIPISLYDSANDRTWSDTVYVNLSAYPSVNINIKGYNAGATTIRGYLLAEGRTPIRVDGSDLTIKVPNEPGASYELILANDSYNQETPYGVANNTSLFTSDFTGFTDVGRNENADDTSAGAQPVNNGEKFISYISAGDVDHYLINIPTP